MVRVLCGVCVSLLKLPDLLPHVLIVGITYDWVDTAVRCMGLMHLLGCPWRFRVLIWLILDVGGSSYLRSAFFGYFVQGLTSLCLIFHWRRYILIVMFFIMVLAVISTVAVATTLFSHSWE